MFMVCYLYTLLFFVNYTMKFLLVHFFVYKILIIGLLYMMLLFFIIVNVFLL